MLPHGTDGDCLSGSIQEKNTPNLSTDGLVLQRFHPGSADSTVRLALQPVYGLFCIWAMWLKQVTSPLCLGDHFLNDRADGNKTQSPGLYRGLSEPMPVRASGGLACGKCCVDGGWLLARQWLRCAGGISSV